MTSLSLAGKIRDNVELDLCFTCQGIWFDSFESQQIAPGGIVELFRLIHDHRDDLHQQLAEMLNCPRCEKYLVRTLDVAKSGRFTYHRCQQNHGHFTVFPQFMIEKGFVRQLNPAEIRELASLVGVVHCTGCGAPIDIRQDAACTHCHSPIAILDPDAVEHALATYQQAEAVRTQRAPGALAEAVFMAEQQRNLSNPSDRPGDLLVSGIGILWQMLKC
jgi:hypothetical protein